MRCVLCDDHPIVLMSQAMLLEVHGHEVAATADAPGELPGLVQEHEPDVCITDLLFGDRDLGEATFAAIREVSSQTDVIVISGAVTAEQRRVALESGAAAVVSKSASGEAVMAMIEGRASRVEPSVDVGPAGPAGRQDHFLTPRSERCSSASPTGTRRSGSPSAWGCATPRPVPTSSRCS